jgi:hypothetical protein
MGVKKPKEYTLTEKTPDFFIVKRWEEGKVVAEYEVDLAMNKCQCDNFHFQPKDKKKKFKCGHIKLCKGLKSMED